jgi:hypothetical protein
MARIAYDPTQAVCPGFEDPEWDFVRQSLIHTHKGDLPLTAEEATQLIKDTWTREIDNKVAAWNAQLEQDRAEQVKQDQRAREEEEAQRAQREKEAEEQRREVERRKPKLNPFDPNRQAPSWIEPRPSPFALNKIDSLEYIELDYFLVGECKEALADSSRNIRSDEDLSWVEMLDAKNTMLHFMAKSGVWLTAHVESMAAFFVALQLHPQRFHPNGKKALLLYQSQVRQEWFSDLKRNEAFNIEIIREDSLRNCAEIINDRIREKEMEQVRASHPAP